MLLTVTTLAVLGVVASALSARCGRFVFLLPAAASLVAAVWFAMQAPVVTTGAGGVKELVDDGVDGLLVDPKQPQQLADAIARILRDPELAARLSSAGRRKIEQSFHSGVSAQVIARNIRQPTTGRAVTQTMIVAS